jgi:hypothetical protein
MQDNEWFSGVASGEVKYDEHTHLIVRKKAILSLLKEFERSKKRSRFHQKKIDLLRGYLEKDMDWLSLDAHVKNLIKSFDQGFFHRWFGRWPCFHKDPLKQALLNVMKDTGKTKVINDLTCRLKWTEKKAKERFNVLDKRIRELVEKNCSLEEELAACHTYFSKDTHKKGPHLGSELIWVNESDESSGEEFTLS